MKLSRVLAPLCLACVLGACSVGPDYRRPAVAAPGAWSAEPLEGWRQAEPGDDQPKGEWWTLFDDPELDRLERLALADSPTLEAGAARLDQARASARSAAAGLWPTLSLDGSSTRTRSSANRAASGNGGTTSTLQNEHILAFTAGYEADLFGRVRREAEAGASLAEQAAADLENLRLVLTAEVAAAYFSLCALEEEVVRNGENAELQERILAIVADRHRDGADDGTELALQTQRAADARAQYRTVLQARSQQRNALATLLGRHGEGFVPALRPLPDTPPQPPRVLPAELLQRRPDVAAAERAVAAANARIGAARAAWFPALGISASDGVRSRWLAALFDAPSRTWSLGADLGLTLFDGGARAAQEDYADAAYRETVAAYRLTVLQAWQEVEDGLSGSRQLGAARNDARQSREAAERLATIVDARHRAGLATARESLDAQGSANTARLAEQQLAARQWINAVYLVKALGGGWTVAGKRDGAVAAASSNPNPSPNP